MSNITTQFHDTLREVFPDVADTEISCLKAGEGSWDSLGHLRLMMAIEASFGISIPPDAFDKLQSVDQIEAYIRSQ